MRKLFPILIAVAAASAPHGQAAPPTWGASSVVVLTLRPAVTLHGTQAAVGDVASLSGGSLRERQRIGALDLIDLPTDDSQAEVSRGRIVYRVLLAGLQTDQFRVDGPASVHINRASSPTITPVSAVTTVTMPPGGAPPAPRLLQDSLVGGKEAPPVLVKCREVVHMVTYVGELKVVTRGEALEDGRAGQLIRLRNVDSSRMVRGRVVDRASVEVDFVRRTP